MTILGVAAMSSLAVAVALAACSPGTYRTDRHAGQPRSAEPAPSSVDYAPNLSAPRTIGRVVTTVAGATLYTFDQDQNGESSCYNDCARQWLPLIARSTTKAHWRMALTRRADGRQQWLYDGKPLYTYIGDTRPGDIHGDNVGNVWHVVR
jgi:predicted lipoprotein with Yx(FWY)xxD motif